jgi:hypothetical protein
LRSSNPFGKTQRPEAPAEETRSCFGLFVYEETPMRRIIFSLAVVLFWSRPGMAVEPKYSIKITKNSPPKELKEGVRKLLESQSVELLDEKGAVICEVWFRADVPVKATAAQIKNGLTYRDNLQETTVLGAVQYHQDGRDYRKQKIKAGVYTLRLGFQPMDGDHMGTAPNPEFCLLIPADKDADPAPIEAKQLHESSKEASGTTHPCVLLLYPNENPKDEMKLTSKEGDAWVLERKQPATAGDKKAALGLGLTLVGVSPAA